jgi:hypothetical protein
MDKGIRKQKEKEKSPPPSAGLNPAHAAATLPPSRPRLPSPAHFRPAPARARQPALRSLSLSLTSRPHPPAAPFLASLAITPTGSVAPLVSHSSSSPPSLHRGHLRPSPPFPPPSSRRTGKFGTAPSSPLDQRPRRYRPAVVSHRRRCAAFMGGAVQAHRRREAPPLPFPSRAYKRAASSPSFPAPASAIPLLPRPSSIRGKATAIVFLSGEPSLSSPCPSVGPSSDCLGPLASPHHHGRSTPLPHPDCSPRAHRRQPRREAPPPPRGQPPPSPPSQIEPTSRLASPSPC